MSGRAEPGRAAITFAWAGGVVFATSLTYFAYLYLVRFAAATGPWPGLHGLGDVGWNVGLFTGFALHHSVLARAGLKQRVASAVGPALVRSTYVWIASLLFVGVCVAWRPVPGVLWSTGLPVNAILHVVQLVGVVLTLRAAARIDVLDLAGVRQVRPLTAGRPAALSSAGGYSIVRHPIYLAWLLLVWPAPVMTGTRLTFAAISTVYLMVAIPLEERDLARTFGPAYEDYRRKVRWRVIPWIY